MSSNIEETDLDWQSLRLAVPSFAKRWRQVERDEGYDPQLAYANMLYFAQHLSEIAVAGQFQEFPPLFATLEAAYAIAERDALPNVSDLLTFGFLEDLIYTLKLAKVDPHIVEQFLVGPQSRAGWAAAYAYSHPRG